MSTVTEIIEAVRNLGEEEKEQLLDQLRDIALEELWDRQMEVDANAGRLDAIWQRALKDIKAGETKPLDEVINDA